MIVCIAEKPSVARDICNVLAAKQGISVDNRQTRQGYWQCGNYQVTWTFGHLCELKEPGEYNDRWKRWDQWDLPMIPQRFGIRLKNDPGIKQQFEVIEKLMKSAEMIINCGDAGQEGELIQRWVMQKAGVKCPVKRLWISSLTEEAIRDGFDNLKDQSEYQGLYEAGLSRAIGDWTLGMNATRLYTIKYQTQRGQVLSIGRVQTPTLALIVNRQQEIDNFVPRQSWVLSTLYRDTKFTAIAHDEEAEAEAEAEAAEARAAGKSVKSKGPIYRQIEYSSEAEGRAVLEGIKDNPLTITDIQKKKGTEAPPRLYDLTSLQVACNNKFGYSADQTLQLIQSLYEKKFTTYPRVDTTFLSDDIYPKCPGILKGIRDYEQFTQPLAGKTLPKSKKVFDSSKVTDHHAIIPTGVPATSLTDMEKHVYDLVTRAFIAVFYPECKFETTTVFSEVPQPGKGDDDKVLFRTSGRVVLDPGWKVIYKSASADTTASPDASASADAAGADSVATADESSSMALFSKGESGPHIPSLSEKWTQPPKPYTDASILRAMETAGRLVTDDELRDAMKENGIGRPSTRASIIETLVKRRYIRRERKNIVATPTGIELIGLIHEDLLKSAELTGIWEKKLRDIEKHTYEARQFIDELKQMVTDIINAVRNDNSNRRVAFITEEEMKKKTKKAASSNTSSADSPSGFKPKKSTKAQAPAAPPPSAPVPSATSTPAAFDTDQWVGMTCPVCKQGTIIKGHTAYGCSRWREGCTYRMPFQ